MFKEQLHTSFDAIRPSPELLDRISAMMNEEVSKKRPPIRMTAVKYGGIAAALAIAAGGTLFFMQSQNRDMEITNTSSFGGSYKAGADDVGAAGSYSDAETAPAIAAEEKSAETSGDAYGNTEARAAETSETTTVYIPADNADEAASEEGDGDTASNETLIAPSNIVNTDGDGIASDTLISDDNGSDAGSGADEQTGEAEVSDEENDLDAAPEADENENPATGDTMYVTSMGEDSYSYADEADEDYADACAAGAYMPEPFGDANDNTGGDGHDNFWFPSCDHVLNNIPVGLMRLCEEDKVDAWQNDWSRQPWRSDSPAVDSIENYQNLYTFIKDMGLTREQVYEGMKTHLESSDPRIKVTEEQLDTILSGDIAAITKMFASEYAIIKGDKAYSPHWLYTHDYYDYEDAGITKEDVAAKYELYMKLGLSDEAWQWFDEKLTYFMEDESRDAPVIGLTDGSEIVWNDTEQDWAGTKTTVYYPASGIMKYVRGEKRLSILKASEEIINGAIKPANVTIDHSSPDSYTIQISYHPEADKSWTWYDIGILMWDDHGYLELIKDGKITVYILDERYLEIFRI